MDKQITDWLVVDYSEMKLPIITMYRHPSDWPDKFIARLWDLNKPTNLFMIADTYQELIDKLPFHMHRVPRRKDDDPVIIESWL